MVRPGAIAVVFSAVGCVDQGVSSIEQRAIACGGSAVVHGMDVAYYDDVTDWNAARASGIEFAFIRATDGTTYLDSKFPGYWAGAKAAGVLRGAYQFFRPAEDPIAQADLLLQKIGSDVGELPPVIDVEVSGSLPPAQVAAAVHAWVTHVAAAIGRAPIVYAGLYSWPTLTGGADETTSPLWMAQYTSAPCPDIPTPWTKWTFWQYSSTGSAPGVAQQGSAGTLDLDIFDGTRDELLAFAAAPPPPCGTIATTGGEIDVGGACFDAGGPPAYLRTVSGAGANGGTLIWTHATDAASEGNFAQWNVVAAVGGQYRVDAYTDHAWATSRRATYLVHAAGSDTAATIDQTAVDGWQTLGTFAFAAGGDQWIHLSDNTGEPNAGSAQLAFDSIRFVPLDSGSGSGSGDGSGSGQPPHHHHGCAATSGGSAFAVALAVVVVARRRRRRR
jgi:uncharacterized protein (TIGR03382 family)